jgi:hypothetical protein
MGIFQKKKHTKIYITVYCITFLLALGLLVGFLFPRKPQANIEFIYVNDFDAGVVPSPFMSFGMKVSPTPPPPPPPS